MAKNKKQSSTRKKYMPLTRLLQIPEGCFDGVPYLEMHGDSTACISGYESLILYDDAQIIFRMKKSHAMDCGFLRVTGEGLLLHALAEGRISISGCIHAIILHPEKEGSGEGDAVCC